MERYFAYGSNMSSARLAARIGAARPLGAARTADRAWRCNKRGRDGTAKANLVRAPGSWVWGVVFAVEGSAWAMLDRFEGGYRRVAVEVETREGARLSATSYESDRIDDALRPSPAYRLLLLAGAREHGLPDDWIAFLDALTAGAGS